ncbi:Up-regulated during septation-domain-containing protein [Lactifluus volemus]|nr:Up-regulated during septation-domain-containing protein [Lactifluus volemus]
MNGMRRFLANATSTPIIKDQASTSSRSPSPTKELPLPPSTTTKALFIRKDRKPPLPVSGPSSTTPSPTTTTTPLRRKAPPLEFEESPPPPPPNLQANDVQPVNTRDALLLSLLSSEAMVDSRGYEILGAEEVEELKKEHTVLSSRVGALQRKLATEAKIRDAAQTLARLNSSASPSPTRISRQSSTALETAERKVDTAQTELWRVQERAANIGRRLLEHRAGVLGIALAEAESSQGGGRTATPDTDWTLIPPSSTNSFVHKFDGAHFFAGHEGSVREQEELEELEAKLAAAEARAQERDAELEDARIATAAEIKDVRAATAKELADARNAAASELSRERAALQRERGRVAQLEDRVESLEKELESSLRGRDDTGRLENRIRTLERELSDTQGRARTEAEAVAVTWEAEKASWTSERTRFQQEQAQLEELSETLEREREQWEQEREDLVAQAKDQIAEAANGLRGLVQQYDIPLFSRDFGLATLVDALGRYLEKHNAKAFEQLLASEAEKRNAVARELKATKLETEGLQDRSPGSIPSQLPTEPRPFSPVSFAKDAAGFVSILQPLWVTLPSPEARAARLSNAARPFRAGSNGRTSPSLRPGATGSPGPNVVSISDMDVRALKTLYTPGGSGGRPGSDVGAGAGRPDSPYSPVDAAPAAGFSVEAFAMRVQALIADDRALIERLIRFAQAHDLLKKNAERAQKLALESNSALETYQRQVRTLEEHLERSSGLYAGQSRAARSRKARCGGERAEQAETLRQLTEANAALSARALQLAQDAATAQDELRAANVVSERGQAQRLALLEEINMVQTENGNLRQQLRSLGKI